MIFVYLAIVVGISSYDIWHLKKKKLKRDIAAHVCCMILVSAIGIIYLANTNQKSVVQYLFDAFSIKE